MPLNMYPSPPTETNDESKLSREDHKAIRQLIQSASEYQFVENLITDFRLGKVEIEHVDGRAVLRSVNHECAGSIP